MLDINLFTNSSGSALRGDSSSVRGGSTPAVAAAASSVHGVATSAITSIGSSSPVPTPAPLDARVEFVNPVLNLPTTIQAPSSEDVERRLIRAINDAYQENQEAFVKSLTLATNAQLINAYLLGANGESGDQLSYPVRNNLLSCGRSKGIDLDVEYQRHAQDLATSTSQIAGSAANSSSHSLGTTRRRIITNENNLAANASADLERDESLRGSALAARRTEALASEAFCGCWCDFLVGGIAQVVRWILNPLGR